MITRLDHVVIAVSDIRAGMAEIGQALGLEAHLGGRHPGAGTENAIIRFRLDYLELLSVHDPIEAAAGRLGGPALVDFLAEHQGPIGYALASDDLDQDLERASQQGVSVVGPFQMSRKRPDGRVLSWRLGYLGGPPWRQPLPFLIQWDESDSERLKSEERFIHPIGATAVNSIAIAVFDVDVAASLYERALGFTFDRPMPAPHLGGTRRSARIGSFRIDLTAPARAGHVNDILDSVGPGPAEIGLEITNIESALEVLHQRGTRTELLDGQVIIGPDDLYGTRFVLAPRSG